MSESEAVQNGLGLETHDESPWEWGVYVEQNHAEDDWTSVIYTEGSSLKDAQQLLRSFWDPNSKSYRNPRLVRRPVGPWEETTMSDQIKGSEDTVREDILLKADDALKQRILKRIGKTEGVVRIEQAEWDFGFCETCSWPEEGLAVYVDGEQVWPNPDVIARIGGNQIGDADAHYGDGVVEVTQYSLFYDWLLGATPEELDEIEARVWEEDE